MSLPTVIKSLAQRIRMEWSDARGDYHAFADIAVRALAEAPVEQISSRELLAAAAAGECPSGSRNDFGEPAIALLRDDRFLIEAIFWFDSMPAIHQHAFAGAFRVLEGSSLHTTYAFTANEPVNARLAIGPLQLLSIEHLTVGDVRPIQAGAGFIHSLCHLERPSVTIVVRTETVRAAMPQYTYYRPPRGPLAIAHDGFDWRPDLDDRLRAIEALRQMDADAAEAALIELVGAIELDEVVAVFLHRLEYFLDSSRFIPVYLAAEKRHGLAAKAMPGIIEQQRREARLIEARVHAIDAQERFLMALLIVAPGQGHILDMMAARFPTEHPIDAVMRLLRAMGANDNAQRADSWFAFFDDTTFEIVEAMLRYDTQDEVLESLRERYGTDSVDEQLEEIDELMRAVVYSDAVGALFADSPWDPTL